MNIWKTEKWDETSKLAGDKTRSGSIAQSRNKFELSAVRISLYRERSNNRKRATL